MNKKSFETLPDSVSAKVMSDGGLLHGLVSEITNAPPHFITLTTAKKSLASTELKLSPY